MALFVYITEKCKEDAEKYDHKKEIEKFAKRIETEQRLTLFDNFPPPYMKKRFKRQMRLLASERPAGEHTVVCFYRLLVRGDREYEEFLRAPKSYGDKYFVRLIFDDLIQFAKGKSQEEHIPKKPRPNEEEARYLWDVMGQENAGTNKVFICETAEWIKSVARKQLDDRLLYMVNLILDASENRDEKKQYLTNDRSDLHILCRYFDDYKKLLLVKPFYKPNENEKEDIERQYSSLLNSSSKDIKDRDILKHSARSYPNEVLLDDDFWLEVERDEEANLALSSEESELLQSVHNFEPNDQAKGFPLFINGRAGSGKSTILLYLFADYLRYYLRDIRNNPRPLYLTCSQDLLDRSREGAERLIKCNHQSLEAQQLSKDQEEMSKSFQVFHRFLFRLVPDCDRSNLFAQEKFINYGQFKSLWEDKFARDSRAREQYGPDHSWHVIRSYIKGLSIDGYMDQEEYAEQPKNERTVTQEKFDTIYEKVWNNWYRDLCEPIDNHRQYWDDQDLVRYLLDQNLIKSSYAAIFCDEAQDFTRIELEALLRLSIFSDRELNPHEINRVPFAFAGDPFQTLNPTGFRWDAIKAAYVSKFIHALDTNHISRGTKFDLNYRELSFNYRSTENIVRLCNTIQGLRVALFGITDLKPQVNWLYEKFSPMPVWFDRGASGVMENLKKQTELVIIVPCEEGEEKVFVQRDSYLNNVVEKDDTGVPQNVLSPTRAKGLEFNRVALYGFGENAPELLSYLNQRNSALAEDQDKALPLEYFINRLYVAASRPKRRLFIIDSQKGLEKLWRFAKDIDVQKRIIEGIRGGEENWKDQFVTLQPGSTDSWEEDREDPAVVGERYERDGIVKRDPYLMRQAALAYQGANNDHKATECRAHALFFEEEYEKSGERFIECENAEKALEALWKGGIFERISKLSQKFPNVEYDQKFRIANFLTKGSMNCIQTIDCIQILKEIKSTNIPNDRSWRRALLRIFDTINLCEEENIDNWQQVASLADSTNKKIIEIPEKIYAEIKYRSHDYEGAVTLWEDANETNNEKYREAKKFILVEKMEGSVSHSWKKEEKRIVAEHYMDQDRYEQSADIFLQLNDSYSIGKILGRALQNDQEANIENLFNMLLKAIIENGEWIEVIRLIEKGSCKQVKDSPKLESFIKKNPERWSAEFTKKIATSDILVQSENEVQSQVSRFLREKYVSQPVKSWIDVIRPEIVGSAIERAGRHMYGLNFYESIEVAEECTDEIKRHASIRWIVCKNKQIDYEKSLGSIPRARKLEEDRDNKIQRIGLNSSDQGPEFPDVDMIERLLQGKTSEVELSKNKISTDNVDEVNWTIEEFTFLFSRRQNRVNIEQKYSMQTASIFLSEKECKSMDVEFSKDQGVFLCEDWGIVVDLNQLDTEQMLNISFSELGISIRIAV